VSRPLGRDPAARAAFRRLARARRPLLLLDLDGTLAPIVDQPMAARVPPRTRQIVQALRRSGATVVLVSGRSIPGVRHVARTAVDAILGDHGARVALGSGPIRNWLKADPARFARIADAVAPRLEGMPGVRFQRKERSLAIHLRLPAHHAEAAARRIARLLRSHGLRVLHGHRVLDGQLPGVDKGTAVLRWLDRHRGHDAILYAGDDTTDDDAFRVLRSRAMTIAIGPRPARAGWRTRDPASFAAWLERLARARNSD